MWVPGDLGTHAGGLTETGAQSILFIFGGQPRSPGAVHSHYKERETSVRGPPWKNENRPKASQTHGLGSGSSEIKCANMKLRVELTVVCLLRGNSRRKKTWSSWQERHGR